MPTIRKFRHQAAFPVDQVTFGPAFQTLLDELESDEFRDAFEEKFALDLSGRPTVTTVRGRCDASDGQIHTDSNSKIITVLIYMNETWEQVRRPAAPAAFGARPQRHHRRSAADLPERCSPSSAATIPGTAMSRSPASVA